MKMAFLNLGFLNGYLVRFLFFYFFEITFTFLEGSQFHSYS